MIRLDDIKNKKEELTRQLEEFRVYANKTKEMEEEVTRLEALEKSNLSITQAVQLAKLKEELALAGEIKGKATKNLYPVLYNASYDLSELITDYMLQEMKNDNELKTLKQEYSKTREKLLQLSVEHDTKYSDKLEKMKKEFSDIGYFTLVEEIADNKDAKLLGLRCPSTSQVKYFNPEQFKIDSPNGMYHEYDHAMKEYKAKKILPWFGKK